MQVQSCCFTNINLFLFCRSRCRRRRRCLSSLFMIQKFCYHGNATSHFSSLFGSSKVHGVGGGIDCVQTSPLPQKKTQASGEVSDTVYGSKPD